MTGATFLFVMGLILISTICIAIIIDRICKCVENIHMAEAYKDFIKEQGKKNGSADE